MARMPKEQREISKNEEVLQMKYEENNKITKKFMDEINEMKSKMDDYDKHSIPDVKHKSKPIRSSEFNTFMKIIDNGDTIEEFKTVTSKEITIKNYVLQKEIDRLNNELVKKDDLNDHLQEENKKLTEEKNKNVHQILLLKEKIRKHDKEVETLTGTLKTRDSEVNRILKEIGCIERKFKHEQIMHEKQKSVFIKTSDENKQLKETVKKLEATHKDAEEKYIKALSKNDDILAKCVREKDVLITGFRKQLELIDSLKRQHVRTKLQEEINILENEFSKLLEGK
ncbi:testis-expressed protein 9-like [Melanaphis sacchari]|uniref:testis-expressed protein 9-like n=1 Tax=Melanaphis sacchari TaxID=742174 RepID=UPI000DC158B6|nr:testis-expressed protein 9-like [Melanaphis sacchari]